MDFIENIFRSHTDSNRIYENKIKFHVTTEYTLRAQIANTTCAKWKMSDARYMVNDTYDQHICKNIQCVNSRYQE